MQLEHSFTVPVGPGDAFDALTDIERVAPCMPGATLENVDGDDFTGSVKVKLGPISLTYKGSASIVEKDPSEQRVVMRARGRDTRGNGTVAATVTAAFAPEGDATRVDVRTDLDITGRPAQFGRGVMIDVGNKLIGQFADCLAGKLSESAAASRGPGQEGPAPASGTAPTATAVSSPVEWATRPPAPAVEAIPLFRTVGPALIRGALAPIGRILRSLFGGSRLRRARAKRG